MIQSIRGSVLEKGGNHFVIEVGGVGFRILANAKTIASAPAVGSEARVITHLHVKEDALELYGFLTSEELEFFEMLISVSGVGPRSALAILDVAEMQELRSAIQEGRPDLMTSAVGIGRKTAERIILELKSKVVVRGSERTVKRMESDIDLTDALASLGYRREEARAALQKVPADVVGIEARLKAALKLLTLK